MDYGKRSLRILEHQWKACTNSLRHRQSKGCRMFGQYEEAQMSLFETDVDHMRRRRNAIEFELMETTAKQHYDYLKANLPYVA